MSKEKTIIEKLCEPLSAEDVELRVGSNFKNGFSLLLYKTARTDVKRLNDVFGLNWQNSYHYDNKGILACTITVKSGDEWVSRTDVGTESMTEKEKGSYSDAFKRAGYKFGIGIELYRSPFIFIKWDMQEFTNPKTNKTQYKPKKFFANNLDVSAFEVKKGIPHFTITYDNKEVWSNLKKVDNAKPEITDDNPKQEKPNKAKLKKTYEDRFATLDRVDDADKYNQVKPLKDKWVTWSEKTFGEEYADQLNDKFLLLAKAYEPPKENELIDDDIPF
jgi:hypothetical protein